jgi:hypothetical protein
MRLVSILLLSLFLATGACAGDAGIHQERVQFAGGDSSAVIKGYHVKGDATVDYVIGARAGQTLTVTLKRSNPQTYFNVNPPGTDVSMFVGSSDSTGTAFNGLLPADGDYAVRVYLMRAAARRGESSDYTLTIGVTGMALAPLPAAQDALLPGTSFHASGRITGVPSFETKARECEAFVIRRGVDGTATIEIPLPNSLMRRILFVKGKPVASDSPEPLTFTRREDVTTVKLGADEWYAIPDALVVGG